MKKKAPKPAAEPMPKSSMKKVQFGAEIEDVEHAPARKTRFVNIALPDDDADGFPSAPAMEPPSPKLPVM